jgi:MFS family permease
MRSFLCLYTAGVTGAVSMATELVGARYLFPDFGSTMTTWAAIIAVFIGACAIGNVVSAWMTPWFQRRNSWYWGSLLIAIWGIFLMVTPFFAWESSRWSAHVHLGLTGAMLASSIIFVVPCFLAGLLSPLVADWFHAGSQGRGVSRTVGFLGAVGSMGCIVGIIGANNVILEIMTVDQAMRLLGAILLLVASLVFGYAYIKRIAS